VFSEKLSEVIALFVHIGEIVLFFFMTKGSCIASNNLTRDSGKLLGVGKWACQSKDSLYLIENILMVKYSKSNTIHTLNESHFVWVAFQ
jgi:hypothetical protein